MILPSTTRGFCLPNNSAQKLTEEKTPWLNTEPIPKFKTKDEYRAWSAHPETNYCYLSLVEGEVSTLRVGGGNKPFRIHGIVADYDAAGLTDAEIAKGLARCPAHLAPYAWNKTFSGGCRMLWRFEHPVFFYSDDVYTKLVRKFSKEAKLKSLLPGLDNAIEVAEIYYACGHDWTINEHAIIRDSLVSLWLYDACKTEKGSSSGVEVPLDLVAAEVEKQFPGRWQGEFVDGARGVRFWADDGDAKSVIVRPSGVICFTGNEPFKSWESIFGREFISNFLENRRGKALSEMYSDGDAYYRRLPNLMWDGMNTEMTRRHLKVEYGLSDKTEKGDDASEIDILLNHLERRKRVTGALPFPLNPNDVVEWNGGTFLNNSIVKLWPAHPEPQEWGINFPWIAQYLSVLFLDQENLEVFLSWLHVWIESAHKGKPCRGQSYFLVGPPGTGKTLLSRQIIAKMVGGYADARDHLVDGGRFNSAMFERAAWCLDDSTVLGDAKAHVRFSSLVKALVANDSFQYEQKFGYCGAVPFTGRLFVTLNDDPISLGILPDADQSLLDKAMMGRTDAVEVDVAATEAERYEIIDRELSSFVRWVIDYEMPAWIERDKRFGIKAWHDAEVLAEARSITPSSQLLEILGDWRVKPGQPDLTKEQKWQGTPSKLYQALCPSYPQLMQKTTAMALGKHVNQAINNGVSWIRRHRQPGTGARMLEIDFVQPIVPPVKVTPSAPPVTVVLETQKL